MLLEAIDEHSTFVIRGWIHRAAHGVERARSKPRFGGVEECACGVGVVAALEKPEESDAIVVEVVVGAVLDRRDAAHQLPIPRREKELSIGGAVEGIPFDVERIVDGDAQRRYPFGVVVRIVDLPWEIDKPAQIA